MSPPELLGELGDTAFHVVHAIVWVVMLVALLVSIAGGASRPMTAAMMAAMALWTVAGLL